MSRAGSAWSSRPPIWRCSPRWCRACGTARSRPTRCSWARSGWAARYGPWPAWSGGWRRPRARASAASSARRGRGSRPARRGSSSSRWTGSVSSPAASRPDVGVVIVAAGAGVRAGPGEPKQFRPIHGVPMLLRALRPFTSHPAVGQVVVAVPAGFAERPPEWLGKLLGERLRLVPGGAARAQSVRAGLRVLPPVVSVVLVHDGARPFVSRETIDNVITRARAGVGAVAAVPLTDTIKEVDERDRITRTVARERLWRAHTPQGFPRAMLDQAYARLRTDDPVPTDDAELCERAGFAVDVIPDTPHNLKVTTADDFRVAEALARELR